MGRRSASVGLGETEGGDTAEAVEEVGETNRDALHRRVRDLVPPGTKLFSRVGVGEVELDAQVGGATEPAAQVVPGEAALKAVRPAAGGRLPVDDAALVVLREGAAAIPRKRRRWGSPSVRCRQCG